MIIRETQRAICPSSAAIEFAATFFAELKNERIAGAAPDRVASMLSCEIVHDASDVIRRRDALKLEWEHNASFLLPNFEGTLTARPACVQTDVTLEGRFASQSASPDGLDTLAVASSRVAMRRLLYRIVSHVEEAWVAFSASCPTNETCNGRPATAIRQAVSA